MADMISLEEFGRVDLRMATVKTAEVHPKANKLLVLRVDLGGEERQLVAGIRAQYRPEDLVGRQVVVVANLAPAKLRGIESRGMVLAAVDGERVVLLRSDEAVAPGSQVR